MPDIVDGDRHAGRALMSLGDTGEQRSFSHGNADMFTWRAIRGASNKRYYGDTTLSVFAD